MVITWCNNYWFGRCVWSGVIHGFASSRIISDLLANIPYPKTYMQHFTKFTSKISFLLITKYIDSTNYVEKKLTFKLYYSLSAELSFICTKNKHHLKNKLYPFSLWSRILENDGWNSQMKAENLCCQNENNEIIKREKTVDDS